MGILDSIFGGGGQVAQPGPESMGPQGIMGRLTATYNPNLYQAKQDALRQQATYGGVMQTPGISPQIAQAMAMNPQFFAAQQGAYLPQAPQTQVLTDSGGAQTIGQITNPGGKAGHGLGSYSGIPITEPPGTTASPAGAAGGAGATRVGEQTGNAPAATAAPAKNTLNMPGNINAAEAAVKNAVKNGQDPIEALQGTPYAAEVKAVLDNRMTLSQIKQTRQEHIAGSVRRLVQAIDPNFNEQQSEKTGTWVKSYMDPGSGLGFQRKTMGTSLGHLTDAIKNQVGLNNQDNEIAVLGEGVNKVRGLYGEQANKVAQQNLQLKEASDEVAKFITGKPPAEGQTNKYAELFPTPFDTPRVAAGKYQAVADLLEKQMRDLEVERNANFGGKAVAKDFPIVQPEHTELLKTLHSKIAELKQQGAPKPDIMGRAVSTALGTSKDPLWGPAAPDNPYGANKGSNPSGPANTDNRGLPPGWKIVH